MLDADCVSLAPSNVPCAPDAPTDLSAWQALSQLAPHYLNGFDLRDALAQPGRFEALSLQAPHVFADLSKQLWDEQVLQHLLDLACASGLPERRAALLAGDIVNPTEQRPALHVQLRRGLTGANAANDPLSQGTANMLALAETIRANPAIHDIVHIGIGGSGLGPELACQALRPFQTCPQRLHFVSNMDGHDLHEALQTLQPQHTLFVVVSKSWSTAETLRNAQSAMDWFHAHGGHNSAAHFVAVTGKPARAQAMGFGVVLDLPDSIGGRFSLWSAVGLPVAIALGAEQFLHMVGGAVQMDAHFAHAPLAANLPVWLGLLDVWNASFLQLPSRCIAPYHHGLRRYSAYIQQLEMESNGKRVRADGTPVNYPTTAAVWGEAGTNGQHAFFQWLHQGTTRVPVEFIVAKTPTHPLPDHHPPLLANALAQAQALMQGRHDGKAQLAGHQDFPGNRPSSFIAVNDLGPAAFGALLALQEHRVFVASTVWRINCFDQWGVELGKVLATDLEQRYRSGHLDGLDRSTAGLLDQLRQPLVQATGADQC